MVDSLAREIKTGDNVTTACWFIILAAFLDVLDGKIARLSGSTSQFGIELDSLADFLSFGVAPATLVFAIKLNYSVALWILYRICKYNCSLNKSGAILEYLG